MKNQTIQFHDVHDEHEDGERACMSRRQFLLAGGAVVTLAAVPGFALAAPIQALKADYPKVRIGRLSALKDGVPVDFAYPYPNVRNILVKRSEEHTSELQSQR